MANSLNRDFYEGDKVVMQGIGPEKDRTVILRDGFGMKCDTIGCGLSVELPNGERARMDSSEIEKVVQ